MNRKVLFVDDDPLVLKSIDRLVRGMDVEVFKACSPAEALSLLNEMSFAVVITDNIMPGMSGIQLLSRIRDISPGTVRVLMTARVDLNTAMSAESEAGISRFILKPWDNEDFLQVIRESLDYYDAVRNSPEEG